MPGVQPRRRAELEIASGRCSVGPASPSTEERHLSERTASKICDCGDMADALLRKVDAVTFNVPDLDAGLRFYADSLGHQLRWRNDEIGQAALSVPDGDTEIVLTTEHGYEPNWLVRSADEAATQIEEAGGTILAAPFDIPVGRIAVVSDPFGNVLVLVDLSKGRYTTSDDGSVTGVFAAD